MLFAYQERPSEASFAEWVWSTQSYGGGTFTSTAEARWELVVTRQQGKTTFTVKGPETEARPAPVPEDAEFLGIIFKVGTFMPHFPPINLLNSGVHLPEASSKSFWLYGSAWEFPTYENADTFVNRLVRAGLVVRDPLVDDVMQDYPLDLSPRALQYRFQRATGLTHKAVQQIQRARQAVTLLEQGCPIIDTAYQLGYFDQSHLTNSLRRYIGQTPAQISQVLQPE
jgi:hypothetical protein